MIKERADLVAALEATDTALQAFCSVVPADYPMLVRIKEELESLRKDVLASAETLSYPVVVCAAQRAEAGEHRLAVRR